MWLLWITLNRSTDLYFRYAHVSSILSAKYPEGELLGPWLICAEPREGLPSSSQSGCTADILTSNGVDWFIIIIIINTEIFIKPQMFISSTGNPLSPYRSTLHKPKTLWDLQHFLGLKGDTRSKHLQGKREKQNVFFSSGHKRALRLPPAEFSAVRRAGSLQINFLTSGARPHRVWGRKVQKCRFKDLHSHCNGGGRCHEATNANFCYCCCFTFFSLPTNKQNSGIWKISWEVPHAFPTPNTHSLCPRGLQMPVWERHVQKLR